MYDRYWNKDLKQARSNFIEAFGYVDDLIAKGIEDPVSFYSKYVDEKNSEAKAEIAEETRPRAFATLVEKNAGNFLISSLIDELEVKEVIDILATARQFQFSIYDMIKQLIISRILYPCSKTKTVSDVFPLLYDYSPMSEDQVYSGLEFIGGFYTKYIELFNLQYEKYYKRNFSTVYFDCTNYYFEIDQPKEDKQKGPSKENRHDPIIGQALLLDSDLIPIAMEMYPGNQSEKPYIRKTIESMKSRYNVRGKTVQVADKGLNCARNIYAAVKEANDGYLFSKAIKGKCLNPQEKEWITLDNSGNSWEKHFDNEGNLLYKLKSCIDDFTYKFKETDSETGEEIETVFTVREKRVVSYNPSLAAKQKAEIMRMVDKAASLNTFKKITKEELGDSSKYVIAKTVDANGKKISPRFEIDHAKVEEDMKLAGYNLLVTSEIKMTPQQIYETYHNLWKIEESFRITKSYLDARPVYLQKKETIYGHFLICYLSLFLLRILELKCFKGKVNTYDIINFIRDFNIVKVSDNKYINISKNRDANTKIKLVTDNTLLDALYLTDDEVNRLFSNTILLG